MDYWRAAAQQFADTPATESLDARNAYAKMASEQAFHIANDISPANSEAVFRYVSLLADQQRFDDAIRVVENAIKAAPENQQFREVAETLRKQNQR